MAKLRPEHMDTHANLYVVQWKWGVSSDEAEMTKWQTITIVS